jgi:antitoxin CcdA
MMRMNHAHAPRKAVASAHGRTNGRKRLRAECYAEAKRPTNLSVRGDLIAAARAARVNLSALLERALCEELVRLKWQQWREENQPAVAVYNHHVKENGAFCRISLRL